MKSNRVLKACLCGFLSVIMVVCMLPASAFAQGSEAKLTFKADGSFKILVFADCQDDMLPRKAMIMEMEKALDELEPDLVVFTGDNQQGLITRGLITTALDKLLEPVEARGIPFAFTFGNHDAEIVGREAQLKIYQKHKGCLTYDANPEMTGCGTCNLPVYASDGSGKAVFNLWMIDSNMYNKDKKIGGYDNVHADQIKWYEDTSKALQASNSGNLVPSLVFQHIPVPEIYELLKPGDHKHPSGYSVSLELNSLAQGDLGEWPCPPNVNSGEFQAMVDRGDVLGIVTGHDHVNSFVGTYKGIDFIQTAGIGFQTYGNELRGCRLITLNESNPWEYDTQVYTFSDFFGEGLQADYIYNYYGSEWSNILAPFNEFFDKKIASDGGKEFYDKLMKLVNLFK